MEAKGDLNRLCTKLEDHLNANKHILDRHGNYRTSISKLRWVFKVGEATVNPAFIDYVRQGHQGYVKHTLNNWGVCIKSVEERLLEKCGSDNELYDATITAYHIAAKIFSRIDPDYTKGYYAIQFSCMDEQGHYVEWHTDFNDITFQYLLGLGNHSGAWIRTCGKDINYRHRVVKMDGRLGHEVVTEEFKGTRFAVIAYKAYDERITEPTPILMEPEIVFSMDGATDPNPIAMATGKKRKRHEEAPILPCRARKEAGFYDELD